MIHIVPSVPPEINGLADYCYKLWQHWPSPRPAWRCLAARLPPGAREHWPQAELREFQPSGRGLGAALNSMSDDVIVLHYVGYAYHPKGVPLWLPGALRAWKKKSRGRFYVMFHELWAKGSPRQSAYYLSPLARGIASRLARDCDGWATSNQIAVGMLVREAGADAKIGRLLPIGSSIDPPPGAIATAWPQGDTGLKVAVFGLPGTRLEALRAHERLLSEACRSGVIGQVSLLGKKGDASYGGALAALQGRIAPREMWRAHDDVSPEQLSQLLLEHHLGLLRNPPSMLTKSSVYAALCAHDLVVLCAPDEPKYLSVHSELELPYLQNDDARPQIALDALNDVAQVLEVREQTRRAAREVLSWSSIARGWAEVVGDAT